MRKVQVTIKIERFDETAPDGKHQEITVYADANNTCEAICAAFYEALDAIQAFENLPSFGRRMSSDGKSRAGKQWDGSDFHLRNDVAPHL
jgi:hypothetical protein